MNKRLSDISNEELELERLLSRIVDGECTPQDSRALAEMASADPQIWCRLAVRQQDMTVLSAHVNRTLDRAERIDLPHQAPNATSAARLSGVRTPWWIALSGWAAMIALVAIWSIWLASGQGSHQPKHVIPAGSGTGELTPDEHLREYLLAPFVVSELPPTLLEVEEQPDGRKVLHILRRIEEFVVLESDDQVPVNDQGTLTKPPSEMRQLIPAMSQPNDL